MPRYIDLDKLNEYPIRLNHYDKVNGNVNFVYGIESVLEYANSLPVFETEITQNWISVKDKMPKPLQNVIVCTDINTVTLAWINGYEWCFADQGNGKIERYGFDVVTHWMPLPEPIKEE